MTEGEFNVFRDMLAELLDSKFQTVNTKLDSIIRSVASDVSRLEGVDRTMGQNHQELKEEVKEQGKKLNKVQLWAIAAVVLSIVALLAAVGKAAWPYIEQLLGLL